MHAPLQTRRSGRASLHVLDEIMGLTCRSVGQDTGPCLSLDLSPDCEVLEPTSGACSGTSSDRADDPSSLGDSV